MSEINKSETQRSTVGNISGARTFLSEDLMKDAANASLLWLDQTVEYIERRYGKGTGRKFVKAVRGLMYAQENYYWQRFNAQLNKGSKTNTIDIEMLCHQLIEGQNRMEKAIEQLTNEVSMLVSTTGNADQQSRPIQNTPQGTTSNQNGGGNDS